MFSGWILRVVLSILRYQPRFKRNKVMKWSMMLRRGCGPMKWALTGSLTLMCIASLLAADVKRVPPDDAMKATTSKTKAEYSAVARQLKLVGSVSLDVFIAEDGTVDSVSVVKGNPILAKSAMDA